MKTIRYALTALATAITTLGVTSCGSDDGQEVATVNYSQAQATAYVAIYENQLQYVNGRIMLGVNNDYRTISWDEMREVSAEAVPATLDSIGKVAEAKAQGSVESAKVKYYTYAAPVITDRMSGNVRLQLEYSQVEEYEDEDGNPYYNYKDKFNFLVAGALQVRLDGDASTTSAQPLVISTAPDTLSAAVNVVFDPYFGWDLPELDYPEYNMNF